MKISFDWLAELVSTSWTAAETARRLTELGFPVDHISSTGVTVSRVISVKILEVQKHPNADRLQVARVTDGRGEKSIVCGASNIAAGQVVPLALPGAKLEGGM